MKCKILSILSVVIIIGLLICVLKRKEIRVLTVRGAHNTLSWKIKELIVESTPRWKDGELNPPLSALRALSITDDIRKNLNVSSKKFKVGRWELAALSLCPLDMRLDMTLEVNTNPKIQRWCYLAEFHGSRQPHAGEPEIFHAIVLMDGSVLVGEDNWRPELDEVKREIYSVK